MDIFSKYGKVTVTRVSTKVRIFIAAAQSCCPPNKVARKFGRYAVETHEAGRRSILMRPRRRLVLTVVGWRVQVGLTAACRLLLRRRINEADWIR